MDLINYQPQQAFSQKHLLTLSPYTKDEILQILSLGLKLKAETKSGIEHHLLKGKSLAMIFAKSSTRTRVSFETGMVTALEATPLTCPQPIFEPGPR